MLICGQMEIATPAFWVKCTLLAVGRPRIFPWNGHLNF